MRLCLVNPPEIQGYVSDRDKAGGIGVAKPLGPYGTSRAASPVGARYLPPTPPLDLLYAAALAERARISLRVVDAIGKRWDGDRVTAEVVAARPTHVGVRISLPSLEEDLALANRLVRRLPGVKVFLFGHAAQTTWRGWLDRFKGDAVLFGEVEALLLLYMYGEPQAEANLLRPTKPPLGCGPSWAYVHELDELPFPAWHHIDTTAYSPTGRHEDFVFYLLTSRGCPKGCSMCPYYVHQGKAWRARSIDNVMAEIDYLKSIGARYVQTRDPNISWRKQHMLALAERLHGEDRLRITTETDLEALSEDDLKKLRAAGFVRIMTGVESVDEAILKEIHQNGNALRRSLENMRRCQALGIEVTGFFIVGSLTETWQSVRATVATARALPCRYSVSLMTPYFGTKMRDAFVGAGFHNEAGYKAYNGYTAMVRTHGLSQDEVVLAHAWASAELELVTRQRVLAAAGMLAKPREAARLARQWLRVAGLRMRVAAAERRNAATVAPAPLPDAEAAA